MLIEVAAAGVCYPDVLLTRGQYQVTPDLPFVPGSEVAGRVRSAPVGSGFAPGDRVAAFPFLGGFAEVDRVAPGPCGQPAGQQRRADRDRRPEPELDGVARTARHAPL